VYGLMSTDARPSTPAIRQKVEGTENLLQEVGLAYAKGKSVLGMFENWIGEAAFRQGVRDYMRDHEWGSAVAEDLWSALSKAAGKDVGVPMATFLEQNGVPLVTLEIPAAGQLVLRQERFLNAGVKAEPRLWQIPIVLKYSDGTSVQTASLLLTEAQTTLKLEATGPIVWLMPNAGERGYYHWNVPPAMLLEIARQAPRVLDARERIGFLGNLSALLDAGVLRGDDYLKILQPFAEDADPLVISAVTSGLGGVKQAFVPAELEEAFAVYVRRTLGPALERFGKDPKPDEPASVTLLRPKLLGWLGVEGKDEAVLSHAETLSKAYLDKPESVDPSLAETALGLAARRGNRALLDEAKRRFETAKTPTDRQLALHTLGSFRDPALMDEILQYALSGPLRTNEVLRIPMGMSDSEQTLVLTFRWTLENFDTIVKRIPPMTASFLPFAASGCSAERLKRAQEFFAAPDHALPGTDKSMAKVADQVQDCVNLRQREGQNAASFLRAQVTVP
jgi:alanyl aminopeptidase